MKMASFLNSRSRRALFLAAALVVLATMVPRGPEPPAAGAGTATLMATPLALDPENPRRRRVGALVYRRGWNLDSDDPRHLAAAPRRTSSFPGSLA